MGAGASNAAVQQPKRPMTSPSDGKASLNGNSDLQNGMRSAVCIYYNNMFDILKCVHIK